MLRIKITRTYSSKYNKKGIYKKKLRIRFNLPKYSVMIIKIGSIIWACPFRFRNLSSMRKGQAAVGSVSLRLFETPEKGDSKELTLRILHAYDQFSDLRCKNYKQNKKSGTMSVPLLIFI